jgi:thimet oligopeptidase
MRRWVRLLLTPLLAAAGVAAHARPPAEVDAKALAFPHYRTAAELRSDCSHMLDELRAGQSRVERAAPAQLLASLDRLWQRRDATLGPITLLAAVHPEHSLRAAASDCQQRAEAYDATWQQSRLLYAALRDLKTDDPIDARLRQDTLEVMEDAGVALRAAQRERLRQLRERLVRLALDFERRVRDDPTQVLFTQAELDGVAPELWRGAPRDAQGRYRLRPDMTTATAVVEEAHDARARERMWRVQQNLGGGANLRTLAEITQARHEMARLLGHRSYAELVLRRRMAGSDEAVATFLQSVRRAIEAREREDLQALREAKALHLQRPIESVSLQRWDVGYYVQRLRQHRTGLDAAQVREALPPEASLQLLFLMAERSLGVSFRPLSAQESPTFWQDDVRAYAVTDTATGALMGHLLTDLYPRAGKYNHAAVWSVRSGSTLTGVHPVAALVANLDRNGLLLDDLELLLHEFGHALHALLAQPRYAQHGGLASLLDFVEAPSQMLEDAVYDPQVMALMREVCPTCPTLPEAALVEAEAARYVARGARTARQHLYASYDLALHGPEPADPMRLWRRLESATPLGHVAGTYFPSNFEHVAGFYAAGYYAYLWSEASAADLRTAFPAGRLDAATGRRYRELLARGAEVHPTELMRRFLGRGPSSDAFFQSLTRR